MTTRNLFTASYVRKPNRNTTTGHIDAESAKLKAGSVVNNFRVGGDLDIGGALKGGSITIEESPDAFVQFKDGTGTTLKGTLSFPDAGPARLSTQTHDLEIAPGVGQKAVIQADTEVHGDVAVINNQADTGMSLVATGGQLLGGVFANAGGVTVDTDFEPGDVRVGSALLNTHISAHIGAGVADNGGRVYVRAGDSAQANGGDVFVQGGDITGAGANGGNVYLKGGDGIAANGAVVVESADGVVDPALYFDDPVDDYAIYRNANKNLASTKTFAAPRQGYSGLLETATLTVGTLGTDFLQLSEPGDVAGTFIDTSAGSGGGTHINPYCMTISWDKSTAVVGETLTVNFPAGYELPVAQRTYSVFISPYTLTPNNVFVASPAGFTNSKITFRTATGASGTYSFSFMIVEVPQP